MCERSARFVSVNMGVPTVTNITLAVSISAMLVLNDRRPAAA